MLPRRLLPLLVICGLLLPSVAANGLVDVSVNRPPGTLEIWVTVEDGQARVRCEGSGSFTSTCAALSPPIASDQPGGHVTILSHGQRERAPWHARLLSFLGAGGPGDAPAASIGGALRSHHQGLQRAADAMSPIPPSGGAFILHFTLHWGGKAAPSWAELESHDTATGTTWRQRTHDVPTHDAWGLDAWIAPTLLQAARAFMTHPPAERATLAALLDQLVNPPAIPAAPARSSLVTAPPAPSTPSTPQAIAAPDLPAASWNPADLEDAGGLDTRAQGRTPTAPTLPPRPDDVAHPPASGDTRSEDARLALAHSAPDAPVHANSHTYGSMPDAALDTREPLTITGSPARAGDPSTADADPQAAPSGAQPLQGTVVVAPAQPVVRAPSVVATAPAQTSPAGAPLARSAAATQALASQNPIADSAWAPTALLASLALAVLTGLGLLGARLFSRIGPRQATDQATRASLIKLLGESPGMSAGQVARALGIHETTVGYHLRLLVKSQIVSRRRLGRHSFYYPAGATEEASPRGAHALRSPPARRLHASVQAQPGLTLKQATAIVGVSRATTHYHARNLIDAGVLRGELEGQTLRLYVA